MPTTTRPCPRCGDERAFETPPCGDGHGPECTELACRDCGTALLVGPYATESPTVRRSALGAAA
ncbi:MAG TPA: hypothetical protein VGP36_11275 [Mycobacteriales bacterium]|jgi:hypothetical protein|nr:hypothetical protein [Mycobacteriales bacterium]